MRIGFSDPSIITEVKPCGSRHAGGFVIAMILVHADGNGRINIDQCVDHPRQHEVLCIGPRAARGLENDRRIAGRSRFHHAEALFHIVDVESRNAIAIFGSMIEQLSQGNPGHVHPPFE